MCNCNDTSPCGKCQNGQPCNCPPDYSVLPIPSPCQCCPNGYIFQSPSATYPNGICLGVPNAAGTPTTTPIPCVSCESAISTNCVTYVASEGIPINCFGIVNGDTLTQMINKMCLGLKANVETILSAIGLDSDLGSGFCALVQNCPSVGRSTTPIIGSIVITFP